MPSKNYTPNYSMHQLIINHFPRISNYCVSFISLRICKIIVVKGKTEDIRRDIFHNCMMAYDYYNLGVALKNTLNIFKLLYLKPLKFFKVLIISQ